MSMEEGKVRRVGSNEALITKGSIRLLVFKLANGTYYLNCNYSPLRLRRHPLKATTLKTAMQEAMKVVADRTVWNIRSLKKEIKDLTAETERLTKELEKDANIATN